MANDAHTEQRLKTFAVMLKFNHDIFNAGSFENAAVSAVNDTRMLLNFSSASIWQLDASRLELAAQFGQTAANIHSEKAIGQKNLLNTLTFGEEPLILDAEHGLPEQLASDNTVYFCFKLPPPPPEKDSGTAFIWLLEYSGTVPSYVRSTAQILGSSIANALYFYKNNRTRAWRAKKYLPRAFWWTLFAALLTGIMFLKVPETVNADFMLKPTDISASYAWFDGPIAKCFKQDGERVEKGDPIVQYDSQQLQYRVAMAKSALQEIEAELALEQQNSFTDREKLGKVKLLEAKRDTLQVSVRESEWYLKHSVITAPASGVLALADGRAELLTGKAVKTGDKLFEIYGGSGMLAEIAVKEDNSSVLQDKFKLDLFLHTAPENAISADVKEVSRYPELNADKTYCYKVRANLPPNQTDLRYGMRGIAKLSGKKVFLWFYLFKNMILYFRSI
ncbi:MAG: HlyD family efflux transporter periplasmic adaptor subunit [Lentisphaeria bacterium]|nr:HlyD family efflux transporter periplasmic adaptor subunit [Lentisphaeria bacterium]